MASETRTPGGALHAIRNLFSSGSGNRRDGGRVAAVRAAQSRYVSVQSSWVHLDLAWTTWELALRNRNSSSDLETPTSVPSDLLGDLEDAYEALVNACAASDGEFTEPKRSTIHLEAIARGVR